MTSEFFPKQRRKLDLVDYDPLLNAQSEKRFRFDFIMPLTGQSFNGMPDFVSEGFGKMEVENSAIDEIDLSTELEEIFFEAYSTDTQKRPMTIETLGLNLEDPKEQLGHTHLKLSNCTLRNFKLIRQKDIVCLKFSLTTRADGGLALWAHTYHGGTLFGEFEHSTVKITSESSSKQMQLTEPALLANPEKGNGVGTEDCPFARAGEKCILNAEHDGEHVMGPISQDVTAGRKRRQEEAVAH